MKAIVYERYGGPEVLQVRDIERPTPAADEVLIRVKAAEVTKTDCEMRSFKFSVNWFWVPLRLVIGISKPRRQVLGGYFSGSVEAVGENVTKFKPGDELFGATGLGASAQGQYRTIAHTRTLVAKPKNLSFEQAAAVPLGGLNALHFMRRARVSPGEKVLVNGAGGSIGSFSVQIAKAMGAEVTAVDSTAKQDLLRTIGADNVVDYTQEDFTQSGQRYDVIMDMVVRSSYGACIRSLKPGGRYLIGNPRISDMLRALLTTRFTDKTAIFAFARERKEELSTLARMIEAGQIKPVLHGVFPMDQVGEAHRLVETEERIGVVVLSLGD